MRNGIWTHHSTEVHDVSLKCLVRGDRWQIGPETIDYALGPNHSPSSSGQDCEQSPGHGSKRNALVVDLHFNRAKDSNDPPDIGHVVHVNESASPFAEAAGASARKAPFSG